MDKIHKNIQYVKFCLYGFLKNLRFFDPFLLLFFREMGFSFFHIGILFSVREITTNIMEIPSGIIADTVGRRKSMVFAFAGYIVSFLIFYFFPSFFLYITAMIFFAFGEAFRTGTHKAMIFEYLRQKDILYLKVDYYGHTRSWSQRGSAVSALIAGFLVFYSGSYRFIFLCSVIPYILGLLLMLTYPQNLDGIHTEKANKKTRSSKDVFLSFIKMLGKKQHRRAILNSALYDSLFKTVKDYIQPVLQGLALSLPVMLAFSEKQRIGIVTGIVYSILYILTSAASQSAGRISAMGSSITGTINITYLLGSGLVFAIGVILNISLPVLAIILFIIYYMLQNLRRPICIGYLSGMISDEIMATGLSGESQAKTLLVAVFSPVLGILADRFGVGTALAVLAAVPVVIYPFVRISTASQK